MHRIVRANRLIRNSRVVTLVGFGLLAAAALAMMMGLIRSRDADLRVLQTLEVQRTAQTLLIATRDAESSVRSFLLSDDKEDLDRFEPSLAQVQENLGLLTSLTADNDIQQDRIANLNTLFQAKRDR